MGLGTNSWKGGADQLAEVARCKKAAVGACMAPYGRLVSAADVCEHADNEDEDQICDHDLSHRRPTRIARV